MANQGIDRAFVLATRAARPLAVVVAIGALASSAVAASPEEGKDAGLAAPAFRELPLGKIKPAGWLARQLRIQADGLSGHLDEFWPDVKDSVWIGGKAEGWERAPYWLDGIVPLAVLTDDPALKAKARRYVDYILDHQAADGWLGPVSDGKHPAYDPWPLFVLFKALTQYQEATGDPRIIPAIGRALRKIDEVITRKPLESWGRFRSADLILAIDWLYDRTREPWLLDLAAKVNKQGFDWKAQFADFKYTGRTERKFDLDTHGVNTGMAVKTAGVWWRHSRDESDREAVSRMLEQLDRYHGQATGMFTCDEHLAGRNPSQGTELCTVVEEMFSLEVLLGILGRPELGDRLERIAFNALPATFKPDMCAHQYDQQANQVVCKLAPERVYVNNEADSNLYGLEPNFGCCTANMHQGWPKLASHLWMQAADGGLVAAAYAPCDVSAEAGGSPVRVEVRTDYPFRESITLAVIADRKARFPLLLRIPAWAEGAEVTVGDGTPQRAAPGTFHKVEREWEGRTELTVNLPMRVRLWKGYRDTVAVERGPLVYSLRIGEHWRKLRRDPPFADWEVYPTTPWNYALQVDREHPERSIRFEARAMGDRPFSSDWPPVVARVTGRLVPWWTLERNAAAPPPPSPVESDQPPQELTLVPYGCTSLRVTEFPTLK
jgi:DUF1680 family protein